MRSMALSICDFIKHIDPHHMNEAVDAIVDVIGSQCSEDEREALMHDLEAIEHRGHDVVSITVSHAHALSQQTRSVIEKTVSQWLQKPVTIRYRHYPALLGGIRIEWEGALVRASALDRLQALKESLSL